MARWMQKRSLNRDVILLPLLALATAALFVVPAELVVRKMYPDYEHDRCVRLVGTQPHGVPNCQSRSKAAEGPWVENRYNECGYRSPAHCGRKPVGVTRIAVLGSSTGSGWLVPEQDSLTGRLGRELTSACGRPVETQNLAVEGLPLKDLANSAREALKLNPDALVLVITSYDLQAASTKPASNRKLARKAIDWFNDAMGNLALFHMARAAVLSRESEYASHVVAQHKDRTKLTSDVAGGAAVLAEQMDQIAKLNPGHKVPIILTFAPDRAEVIDSRLSPDRSTPASLIMKKVAEEKGVYYTNTLDFTPKQVPTALMYYVVSYHPNSTGSLYLTHAVEHGIRQAMPPLRACRPS
ncbi:MAG: hypothetical protein ABW128_14155 [Rhizorhabdus sp.]